MTGTSVYVSIRLERKSDDSTSQYNRTACTLPHQVTPDTTTCGRKIYLKKRSLTKFALQYECSTGGPRLVQFLGFGKNRTMRNLYQRVLHSQFPLLQIQYIAIPLKYGSEEKGSSLCRCSILLGFIVSKNLRGL